MSIFTAPKSFLRNTSGNFAMTLALVAMPVMLGIGVAVDYSGISREQNRLQNTLDTAILAVGQDFMDMKKGEIRSLLKDYLKANLPDSEYQQIKSLNIDLDRKNNSLTVTAEGKSETSFMLLAGMDQIEYEAMAQIKSASGGAEIVFVLDNTGSMTVDGKLDALKAAAKDFTDKIMVKNTGGLVKIGIVPFANYVNVGLSNRNASWIDVPEDSTTDHPEQCYMTRDVIPGSCTTETGINSEGQTYTYLANCSYGPEYQKCNPAYTSTSTWHGCVGSREEPYNLEDRDYGTRKVPGLADIYCGAPITPLTDSKSTVLTQIDAMSGSGNTYIPAGLTWGMRLLSSKAPFGEAVALNQAKKKNIKKFLILMTDGDNTASAELPVKPTHWGTDVAQANDWTQKACNNIKADKYTSVYTITFGTLMDETKDLMKNCASKKDQYFHASTGADLAKTFRDIRASIMDLHLSM